VFYCCVKFIEITDAISVLVKYLFACIQSKYAKAMHEDVQFLQLAMNIAAVRTISPQVYTQT
jgi:hypothetical protein